ncbi:hypothetical protein [Mycoplasmopsis iners]|uniref:hypothetical protein n=1 Tax=Mycoplasmopsis iners TaxID=76630 RepID=UPI00049640FE|nr:hypothetical protein [Mycoplasmopsis iners]
MYIKHIYEANFYELYELYEKRHEKKSVYKRKNIFKIFSIIMLYGVAISYAISTPIYCVLQGIKWDNSFLFSTLTTGILGVMCLILATLLTANHVLTVLALKQAERANDKKQGLPKYKLANKLILNFSALKPLEKKDKKIK